MGEYVAASTLLGSLLHLGVGPSFLSYDLGVAAPYSPLRGAPFRRDPRRVGGRALLARLRAFGPPARRQHTFGLTSVREWALTHSSNCGSSDQQAVDGSPSHEGAPA